MCSQLKYCGFAVILFRIPCHAALFSRLLTCLSIAFSILFLAHLKNLEVPVPVYETILSISNSMRTRVPLKANSLHTSIGNM